MRRLLPALVGLLLAAAASAQRPGGWMESLPRTHDYALKRASSYDRTGGNADYRPLDPGQTLVLMDANGPGEISHIWITISSGERYHLKKLVLRMYWDGEETPSVETPVGDFFGLGLGDYFQYQSIPLAVGSAKALNCFFPMPFRKHARITLTNEGNERAGAIYWNIDYRAYHSPLPDDLLYFHAQYRQATPNRAILGSKTNLDGKNNYVWMEAAGRGQFVGVTMSVLENADGWWGEGDDMFFVDGEKLPSINGTGTEDYFLGAWDFGGQSFAYGLFGAPVVGPEVQGSRWSVYRFHLDSPIPFSGSLRATIEHGHANDRGDNYYSVAYWYQTEPHAAFPQLPPVQERIPRVIPPLRNP
ncbi:MAG TPA: glycoside hydrolase family 172 protein [Candidatus Acidoferrales bacterium]|nr:glycoside hydrolase family 172 protein [Candidatus Acidoferrales bacterium]